MNKIAELLLAIHTHAEEEYDFNPDSIVYREKDVVELLIRLGHPAPVWEDGDPANNIKYQTLPPITL